MLGGLLAIMLFFLVGILIKKNLKETPQKNTGTEEKLRGRIAELEARQFHLEQQVKFLTELLRK